MLMVAISSTSVKPTAQAAALVLILAASLSRVAASSFFESSTPGMRDPGANTTAAAATGPASGLMPASSTPATYSTPPAQRTVFQSATGGADADPRRDSPRGAARQHPEWPSRQGADLLSSQLSSLHRA